MKKFFPILHWLPRYEWRYIKNDAIAGLTVGTMLIPQGMAYALLAGLPPIMGLYAALIPLIVYPLMGTSRQLSVGPVAMDSLLVAVGVSVMARQGSEEYIALAMLLAVMVGVLQFLMGMFRLGFLVNFLSQPLISGFTSAAALIIAFSQVKHILGIDFAGSQQIYKVLWRIGNHLHEIHWVSLEIGIGCLLLLLVLKKWRPSWPGAMIAIILSTLFVWLSGLDKSGLAIVGAVPDGFPKPAIPNLQWTTILEMLPLAATIALISFMEAIAVAKKIAAKEGYTINANQELMALGVANSAAGIFNGYPIAGSFSRTAVNAEAGAKSALSSIFNAIVIGVTLLLLTPLFYYMPKAVLAAIVIVAVSGLIDIREARRLFYIRRQDFMVLIFAFAITLLFGAFYGIILSAVASLVLIIQRISRPHIALLGQIPGTNVLRNPKRAPNAEEIEGLIIFRMDASLYYANVSYLKDKIQASIARRDTPVKAFILDATSINEIDATAALALYDIIDELHSQDVEFYLTNVKGPVRDVMARAGLYEKLGRDHFFFSKKAAVKSFLDEQEDTNEESGD